MSCDGGDGKNCRRGLQSASEEACCLREVKTPLFMSGGKSSVRDNAKKRTHRAPSQGHRSAGEVLLVEWRAVSSSFVFP